MFFSDHLISFQYNEQVGIDELMDSKGGKKKSSSSSLCYEAPLGYTIEDVRPNGGIKKFRSAAYSNVSQLSLHHVYLSCLYLLCIHANCLLISVFFVCSALASHPEISRDLE